jgi:hypothetical protein
VRWLALRRAAHSAGRPGARGAQPGQPRRAEPAGWAQRRQEACAEGPPQPAVFAVAPQPLPAAEAEFRSAPAGGLVDRGRPGRGAVADRAAGAARFEARRLAPGASHHPMRPPGECHRTSRRRPASLRKSEKMFVSCGFLFPRMDRSAPIADSAHMRKTAQRLAAMPTTRQNYGDWLPRSRHGEACAGRALCAQSSAVTCRECGGAAGSKKNGRGAAQTCCSDLLPQTCRSTSSFLMSAIALAGLRPLGQALAQFMMVWQRYRRNGSSRSSSRAPMASSRLSLIQR